MRLCSLNRRILTGLDPLRRYRIGIRSVWYDGTLGENAAEVTYRPEIPEVVYLSELEPETVQQEWGSLGRDRSVDGNRLEVGGESFERGLGTHARSEIRYELYGAFERFRAFVGIDDEVDPPEPVSVIFEVWGDGRRLWSSAPIANGRPPLAVDVDIEDVQEMLLRVLPVGESIDYNHADWLDAYMTGVYVD